MTHCINYRLAYCGYIYVVVFNGSHMHVLFYDDWLL